MTVLVAIDESSGVQNTTQSGVTSNDTNVSIPLRFQDALAAAGTVGSTLTLQAVSGSTSASSSGTNVLTFGVNTTDVAFTDGSGNDLNGLYSDLNTTGGDHIFLYTSSFDNNVVLGRVGTFDGTTWSANASGTVAFAAFLDTGITNTSGDGDLNATGAKVWLTQFLPLYHSDPANANDIDLLTNKLYVTVNNLSNFSLAGAPSGQNAFLMFGDPSFTGANADKAAVVVTGRDPTHDTVNTGQGGGMTTIGTNNQMIDPSEGMYFTFVKGPNADFTVPNLDQNEADLEADILFDSYLQSSGASFVLSQLQPPKGATVRITALDDPTTESGTGFYAGYADDAPVDVTSVTITRVDKQGNPLTPVTFDGSADGANVTNSALAGVSMDFSGDAVTITGLKAGDKVAYVVDGDHNRVLIENAGNADANLNAAFDIGNFQITAGGITQTPLGDLAFVDDAPSITLGTPTDTTVLNTQDAQTIGVLTDTDTQGFLSSFSVASSSYGADGAGTLVGSFALSLGSGAPNSGLTSEGSTIYLYLVSGVVVGSTATTLADVTAANTVFDVSVGASTGDVTLNQYQEIDHALPGATSNYSSQQAVLPNDKIILTGTGTITDGDGDTASASKTIDLGGNIKFDDDGPTASIVRTAGTITLDETVGAKAGDPNAATDDISVSNPDPFAAAYGAPIGAISGVDLVDTTVTTGADHVGATTAVSLAIVGGNGASSGLTTSDGTAINLYLESNGTVTGRTGSASGAVIFAVKIDGSGNVSVAQYAGLAHAITSNPDDSVDLSGKLNAVVVETDGDGDTATNSVGIGDAIVFQDDGPTLAVGNLVGTGSTLPQIGYWAGTTGTDGLGTSGVDITLDAFTLIRPDSTTAAGTITSFSEQSPSPDLSGNYHWAGTLTGDFDNDASTADSSVDFTLTAYTDGHYALDLVQGFQSSVTLDTANGALGAGGPDPVQTLTIPKPPATPQATVVFFSALVGATDAQILADVGSGVADPNEATLQGPPLATGIDPRSMNVSTSGIGVDNNLLQGDTSQARGGTDESFVANPDILCTSVTVNIDNSVGGYSYSGGERMEYRVVYDDGSFSNYTLLTSDLGLANKGQATSFTVDTVAGKLIDAVQITMDYGDVKIPNILFTKSTENLAASVKLDFTATITDQDGDSASDPFTALLNASQASGSTYDFVLAGTASVPDAFNVDLSSAKTSWEVTGFDTASDALVFLGDATATATIDNSGANSVVTVTESGVGGQTTTVTVVGVDLLATDVSGLGSVSVI